MSVSIFILLALYQNVILGSQEKNDVELRAGIQSNGMPTFEWIDALKNRKTPAEIENIQTTKRFFDYEEKKWISLLSSAANQWSSKKKSLSVPFVNVDVPVTIIILYGNQGGDDGFTFRDNTVCIDLAACVRTYGSGDTKENEDRLVRLLSHEYTHLLHRAWLKKNPAVMKTPLDRALFECLYEGLGNYRSLSNKWINKDGSLTAHAESTLIELQPIFVDRISKLASADSIHEEILTKDLSRGPFNKKWGALCVALWLANEANGNDLNLVPWVQAGHKGVITLAKKYLPDELKKKFLG